MAETAKFKLASVEDRFEVGESPLDEPATDFGHRQSLGLHRTRTMVNFGPWLREPQLGATAELLGAQRSDIDKQESAFDGRRGLARCIDGLFGADFPLLDF
jgi:hypothetical protein